MPGNTHTARMIRPQRSRRLALTALVSGLLLAGCGGSSPQRTGSGQTTTKSEASARTSTDPRDRSTRTTASTPRGSGPLAFAKCMRANGVPNFPDPSSSGGAAYPIPAGSNPAAPAFRAARAKCQKLGGLPAVLGSTTHPTAQTMQKLVRIARCMRAHRVPQFPDPRTSVPSNPTGYQEITDFDSAILLFPTSINLESPAYKQALKACGAPPLGLPH